MPERSLERAKTLPSKGKFLKALKACQIAEQESEAWSNTRYIARSQLGIGTCKLFLGHPSSALHKLRKAAQTFRRTRDWFRLARSYVKMAMAYERLGTLSGARNVARRALRHYTELRKNREVALCRLLLFSMGGFTRTRAVKALERSRVTFRAQHMMGCVAQCEMNLALL